MRQLPEEFTPIDETVSTSGKYAIAFGQHFRPGLCYDVIALNVLTGEATRRHYADHKHECLKFWEEFKNGMTAPVPQSEGDEVDKLTRFDPN